MKDSTFSSNSKLFSDIESVKRSIREEIHNKCRNVSSSPSVNSKKEDSKMHNKALHRTP
jgi:hypothetical protein